MKQSLNQNEKEKIIKIHMDQTKTGGFTDLITHNKSNEQLSPYRIIKNIRIVSILKIQDFF